MSPLSSPTTPCGQDHALCLHTAAAFEHAAPFTAPMLTLQAHELCIVLEVHTNAATRRDQAVSHLLRRVACREVLARLLFKGQGDADCMGVREPALALGQGPAGEDAAEGGAARLREKVLLNV